MYRIIVQLFFVSLLAFFPLPLKAENVRFGKAFGVEIGKPLPGYSASDLWFELLGPPYVKRTTEAASPEFDHLEIIVTPLTGTVVGVRAVAIFSTIEGLQQFVQRMSFALSAKYGESQLFFFWHNQSDSCPEEIDLRFCRPYLSAEIDRYARILPDRRYVQLMSYQSLESGPEAALVITADDRSPETAWLWQLLKEETESYYNERKHKLLTDEADGLLKGLE